MNSLYGSATCTLLCGMNAHAFQTMSSARISQESGPTRNGGGSGAPPGGVPRGVPGSRGERDVDLRFEPRGSCERAVLSAMPPVRQASVLDPLLLGALERVRDFLRKDACDQQPVLCLVHDLDAVAPLRLRAIERFVSELQRTVRAAIGIRNNHGDAYADSEHRARTRSPMLDAQRFHAPADLLRAARGAAAVGVIKNGGELL